MEIETTEKTEELVNRFRDYLTFAGHDTKNQPEKLDLFSLYSEIKALKNEVKIESRHIKQGFVEMQEVLQLHEENDFSGEADQDGPELAPLLDGIIDLYDRIHASIRALPEPGEFDSQPEGKKRKIYWSRRQMRKEEQEQQKRLKERKERLKREQDMIASMRAGQQMLLDRILGLLLAWDITPVKALEQRFDPHSMRALGTDTLPDLADGVVSAEIRTGFQQEEKILRLADVRVNRVEQGN